MSSELMRRYRGDIAAGTRQPDSAQERAVGQLDKLSHELCKRNGSTPSFLQGFMQRLQRKPPAPVRGLYAYGGVGRGKTYLMDLFFETLPFPEKKRMHFHRFMHWLHAELRARKGQENPIPAIISEFAGHTRVLCFDEFFVSDIGDAMLLATALTALCEQGVSLVATSNVEPKDLYRNGLQRDNFLPAIALIERHCQVLEIDGGVDYRLRELQKFGVYLTPDDSAAEKILEGSFQALCGTQHQHSALTILGRTIHTRRRGEGVAWFAYSALCAGARSQADYIELSKSFHTVLLSNVPQLDQSRDDEARRFIALVDEFYERQVKMLLSCAVELEHLYTGELLSFPFARTRSRLQEMQTESYLRKAHLP